VVADDHEIINHGADSGHWDCCPGTEDIAAGIAMAVKLAAEEEGRVGRVFVWFEFCTPPPGKGHGVWG
jgi:hypothetical protein